MRTARRRGAGYQNGLPARGASRGVPRRPSSSGCGPAGQPARAAGAACRREGLVSLLVAQTARVRARSLAASASWIGMGCSSVLRIPTGESRRCRSRTRDDEPWPSHGRCGPGRKPRCSGAGAQDVGRLERRVGRLFHIAVTKRRRWDGTPVPAPGLRCSATVLPCLRRLRQPGPSRPVLPSQPRINIAFFLTSVRRTPPSLALCRSDSRFILGRSATRSSRWMPAQNATN